MISKSFIQKFLGMLDKVDTSQVSSFLERVTGDLDFLTLAFDHYNDGIVIFDDKMIVEYANRKALEILRFDTVEEIQEKSLTEIIYSPDFREYLKQHIQSQKPIVEEEHLVGAPFARVLRVNFMPLRDNTNLIRYHMLSFSDITRKKLEEIKNRRKENISSMFHLAAGIAHEIKNPLASIDIHLQLLNRFLTGAPEFQEKKEMTHFINVLKDEVSRLNSIVQDFLTSIRPSSFELQKVDIAQILQGLFEFLSLEFNKNRIMAKLLLEENLPSVIGDPRYLRVVFLNLLKNSIESFPEGQEDKQVKIKTTENYPFVELTIEDNGRGIPRDKLDKIFDPYFTTKSTGTGIGLTTVHKVITEHGGNIKVESEEGQGTRFIITIPQYQGESTKYIESNEK